MGRYYYNDRVGEKEARVVEIEIFVRYMKLELPLKHLSEDVKWAILYINQGKDQVDINFGIIAIQMIFKITECNEIT